MEATMPLLDHFRPPLSGRRHGHSFHNSWATYLSSQLNALLPEGYFAEANVQYGVEIDVAAFEASRPASTVGLEERPQRVVEIGNSVADVERYIAGVCN